MPTLRSFALTRVIRVNPRPTSYFDFRGKRARGMVDAGRAGVRAWVVKRAEGLYMTGGVATSENTQQQAGRWARRESGSRVSSSSLNEQPAGGTGHAPRRLFIRGWCGGHAVAPLRADHPLPRRGQVRPADARQRHQPVRAAGAVDHRRRRLEGRDARILAEYAASSRGSSSSAGHDRGDRKLGGGVIDAFYAGYDTINPDDFDYVCKLDLDLDLPPRYFERLMARMEADPRIGTASGKPLFIDPATAARSARCAATKIRSAWPSFIGPIVSSRSAGSSRESRSSRPRMPSPLTPTTICS